MSIVRARDLTQDDLEYLGSSVAEIVEAEREELLNPVLNRPPKDYACSLSVEIKSKVIRKAIGYVLKRISEEFYGDALCLEERVVGIRPLENDSDWLGCWDRGYVLLKDDEEMDFGLACMVFAHECGHAVYRGEYIEYVLEGVLYSDIKEAAANYYVQRWGFGRQLKDAISKGLRIVTRDELDRLRSYSQKLWMDK